MMVMIRMMVMMMLMMMMMTMVMVMVMMIMIMMIMMMMMMVVTTMTMMIVTTMTMMLVMMMVMMMMAMMVMMMMMLMMMMMRMSMRMRMRGRWWCGCWGGGRWWSWGGWCWGGRPIPRPWCASLRSRNARGHVTRGICAEIYRETAASILCEPAQSKCTWTCHKRHFVRKFTGKMPNASNNTSSEHRALTLTVRTPSVWPHSLRKNDVHQELTLI